MSHVVKIYALFLGSALLMFGGEIQGLLLPIRGAQEQFSVFALGLIGTGWSVGFIAGSILVPRIVRSAGHIRAFSVMAVIGTVTILLNLLWINDIGWIVLRALSGFCFAGAAMIVESWLNEFSDNRSRGTIFSLYVAINLASSTLGQLAISITGVSGYVPFVVGAISFICAVLPTALTSTPQPRPLSSAKLDLSLLLRTSPVAAMAALSVGMANGAFGTLGPVFGFQQQMDSTGIALLMSLAVVLGAVSQIPLGRLSDQLDRRLVLVVTGVVAAVAGLLILIVNPTGGPLLYVFFAIYGLAAYPLYSVAVAHANDFAKEGDFARIASSMLVIFGIGLALGPPLGALVMLVLQRPSGLFLVTAVFHLGLAGFAYWRMRMRPLPNTSRMPFQPIAVTSKGDTLESVTLDPRATPGAVAPLPPRPEPARAVEPALAPAPVVEPTTATAPVSIAAVAVEPAGKSVSEHEPSAPEPPVVPEVDVEPTPNVEPPAPVEAPPESAEPEPAPAPKLLAWPDGPIEALPSEPVQAAELVVSTSAPEPEEFDVPEPAPVGSAQAAEPDEALPALEPSSSLEAATEPPLPEPAETTAELLAPPQPEPAPEPPEPAPQPAPPEPAETAAEPATALLAPEPLPPEPAPEPPKPTPATASDDEDRPPPKAE